MLQMNGRRCIVVRLIDHAILFEGSYDECVTRADELDNESFIYEPVLRVRSEYERKQRHHSTRLRK